MADQLNLENVLVLDPKVNVEETWKPKEIIHKSGVNKSRFVIPSDSVSNSSFLWQNVVPPSSATVVERTLRIKYQVQVVAKVGGTAGGSRTAPPDAIQFAYLNAGVPTATATATGVLRSFPLQQCCSGIDLKINGNSMSCTPTDFIQIFPHLLTEDEHNYYCGEFPTQKDYSSLFVDADRSARSAFAQYSANPDQPSRLSHLASSAVIGGSLGPDNCFTDTYLFDVVETIIVSPMTWGSGVPEGMGLANIQNITLNIKFDNINKMVCVMNSAYAASQPNVYGSVAVNLAGTGIERPQMLVEYITQAPELAMRMPPELVYPYELVQAYRTQNLIAAASGAALQTVSNQAGNTLKLGSIPDRLFVYCCPSLSALNTTTTPPALPPGNVLPNTFLRIKQFSLNFNNRVSLFNSYSEEDLYKMSVANGLKSTLHEWKYRTGSVLIIDITKDVQLDPNEMAGQSSTYMTLQPTITADNSPLLYTAQPLAVSYDLVCVAIISGKAVISKQSCQILLTAPDGQEVVKALGDSSAKLDASQISDMDGKSYGGSLFSGAKKLLHSGVEYLQKHPEHLEKGLSAAKSALAGDVSSGALKARHHKSKRVY